MRCVFSIGRGGACDVYVQINLFQLTFVNRRVVVSTSTSSCFVLRPRRELEEVSAVDLRSFFVSNCYVVDGQYRRTRKYTTHLTTRSSWCVNRRTCHAIIVCKTICW